MEGIHFQHRGPEMKKLSPFFLTLPQLAQVNQVFPVFGLWGVEGWMFYLASCLACVWSGLTLTCSSDQHSEFKQLWQGRRRTVIGVGTIEASVHDQSSLVNIHHLRQLSNMHGTNLWSGSTNLCSFTGVLPGFERFLTCQQHRKHFDILGLNILNFC